MRAATGAARVGSPPNSSGAAALRSTPSCQKGPRCQATHTPCRRPLRRCGRARLDRWRPRIEMRLRSGKNRVNITLQNPLGEQPGWPPKLRRWIYRNASVVRPMQSCGPSLRGCLSALPQARHVAAFWQSGLAAARRVDALALQRQPVVRHHAAWAGLAPCLQQQPRAIAAQRLNVSIRSASTAASAPAETRVAGPLHLLSAGHPVKAQADHLSLLPPCVLCMALPRHVRRPAVSCHCTQHCSYAPAAVGA